MSNVVGVSQPGTVQVGVPSVPPSPDAPPVKADLGLHWKTALELQDLRELTSYYCRNGATAVVPQGTVFRDAPLDYADGRYVFEDTFSDETYGGYPTSLGPVYESADWRNWGWPMQGFQWTDLRVTGRQVDMALKVGPQAGDTAGGLYRVGVIRMGLIATGFVGSAYTWDTSHAIYGQMVKKGPDGPYRGSDGNLIDKNLYTPWWRQWADGLIHAQAGGSAYETTGEVRRLGTCYGGDGMYGGSDGTATFHVTITDSLITFDVGQAQLSMDIPSEIYTELLAHNLTPFVTIWRPCDPSCGPDWNRAGLTGDESDCRLEDWKYSIVPDAPPTPFVASFTSTPRQETALNFSSPGQTGGGLSMVHYVPNIVCPWDQPGPNLWGWGEGGMYKPDGYQNVYARCDFYTDIPDYPDSQGPLPDSVVIDGIRLIGHVRGSDLIVFGTYAAPYYGGEYIRVTAPNLARLAKLPAYLVAVDPATNVVTELKTFLATGDLAGSVGAPGGPGPPGSYTSGAGAAQSLLNYTSFDYLDRGLKLPLTPDQMGMGRPLSYPISGDNTLYDTSFYAGFPMFPYAPNVQWGFAAGGWVVNWRTAKPEPETHWVPAEIHGCLFCLPVQTYPWLYQGQWLNSDDPSFALDHDLCPPGSATICPDSVAMPDAEAVARQVQEQRRAEAYLAIVDPKNSMDPRQQALSGLKATVEAPVALEGVDMPPVTYPGTVQCPIIDIGPVTIPYSQVRGKRLAIVYPAVMQMGATYYGYDLAINQCSEYFGGSGMRLCAAVGSITLKTPDPSLITKAATRSGTTVTIGGRLGVPTYRRNGASGRPVDFSEGRARQVPAYLAFDYGTTEDFGQSAVVRSLTNDTYLIGRTDLGYEETEDGWIDFWIKLNDTPPNKKYYYRAHVEYYIFPEHLKPFTVNDNRFAARYEGDSMITSDDIGPGFAGAYGNEFDAEVAYNNPSLPKTLNPWGDAYEHGYQPWDSPHVSKVVLLGGVLTFGDTSTVKAGTQQTGIVVPDQGLAGVAPAGATQVPVPA
jgi:hypothetical protein